MPYRMRLDALTKHVNLMRSMVPNLANRVRVIPHVLVHTLDDLLYHDSMWLSNGYEGTIIRDPDGKYKQGRSTAREGGLLRIKRFTDAEMLVTGIEEGQENQNEATVNPLGHTERSTHAANMVPNGMVGRLLGIDTKTQQPMVCSPGRMTHQERIDFFNFPHKIVGKHVKYKHFEKGRKDAPRFPTYQCIRVESDIGVDA